MTKRFFKASGSLRRFFQYQGIRGFSQAAKQKPVVLCILDGWGNGASVADNAVVQANTPSFDRMWETCDKRGLTNLLNASEKHVGLPDGQIGNSEVGHMNIGAGRVVYQDICRIDNAIADGSLAQNEVLAEHISTLKASGGTCHLMGLVSPGGVHSHQHHIAFLANHISGKGVPVAVHVFTDGRDVPPKGAQQSLPEFAESLSREVKISSVSGRYYAMDRDTRWERVTKAYNVLRYGDTDESNPIFENVSEVLKSSYGEQKLTDEFILPSVIKGYSGMKKEDGILMANFRADRAREILQMFTDTEVQKTNNIENIKLASYVGLVSYSKTLDKHFSTLLPDKELTKTLGQIVSEANKTQLRLAETEKYPHVTFFFNGGQESPFAGEDRVLVPSPRVATYDLQPEMSADEVCSELCKAVEGQKHDLIVVNFANPDMVGHTGDLDAAKKACEAVDECLNRIKQSLDKVNGVAFITADHGNCEQMWNHEINEPHTAHTLNQVPCMLYTPKDDAFKGKSLKTGSLSDIAPTLLELLEIKKPEEMTGTSLLN